MRIEIPLAKPMSVVRPLSALIEAVVQELVDEGKIKEVDVPKACDAALASTAGELLDFRLRISGEKAWVIIELKDDAAARTIMRQAAFAAVRLKT